MIESSFALSNKCCLYRVVLKNGGIKFCSPKIKWTPNEQIFEEFSQNWSKNYVPIMPLNAIQSLKENMKKHAILININVDGISSIQIKEQLMQKISMKEYDRDDLENVIDKIINFMFHAKSVKKPKFWEKFLPLKGVNKISQITPFFKNNVMICHRDSIEEKLIIFVRFTSDSNDSCLILFFENYNSPKHQFRINQLAACCGRLLRDEGTYRGFMMANEKNELCAVIDEYVNKAYLLQSNSINEFLRPSPAKLFKVHEKILDYNKIMTMHQSNDGLHVANVLEKKKNFNFKKTIFRGFKEDVINRSRVYLSDFTDGLHFQIIISTIFMYFACLAPLITFGGLLSKATEGNLGTIESLISGAIGGIIYSLFSGQPITILGSTGPILVFESITFQMCNQYHLCYLSFRLWIGIWIFALLFVIVAFNISDAVKYITRFTEECFATLISVIYIFEAIMNLVLTYKTYPLSNHFEINQTLLDLVERSLKEIKWPGKSSRIPFFSNSSLSTNLRIIQQIRDFSPDTYSKLNSNVKCLFEFYHDGVVNEICETGSNVFLFSLVLAIGTYTIATNLKKLQSLKLFPPLIRNLIVDSAVILSIIFATAVDHFFQINTPKLHIPHTFQPTKGLDNRLWIIFPFNGNPLWTVLASFIPALFAVILIFLDQQITTVIINKDPHLKKSNAYHLDLMVLAILILINSFMGTPWFVAATVLSINHMNSLRYHSQDQRFLCREQRVSGLLIGITIGMTVMLTPILKMIPMSVLYGVFLIMGISSLEDIEFIQRIKLLLTPYKDTPDYPYLRHVKWKRVHLFTVIQITSFIILWTVKSIKYISIIFPFMVLAMCFIRKILENVFTIRELFWLDDLYPGTSIINSKEFKNKPKLIQKDEFLNFIEEK